MTRHRRIDVTGRDLQLRGYFFMGPTNVALVKLFQADQELRAAQARLDAASKNVRVQQRRVDDLAERHRLGQSKLMESKSQSNNMELDLKTRDEHIEKLRTQQTNSKNNKEYQAFLIEISTEKVDKGKIEDELMKLMEQVESSQKEAGELSTQLESESAKLATMKQQSSENLASLQAEIDALKEPRDEAEKNVPAKAREMFERLAERHDGEALARSASLIAAARNIFAPPATWIWSSTSTINFIRG